MYVRKVETKQQLLDAFSIRKTVFVEEQKVPVELEIDEFEDEAIHFVLYKEEKPIGAGRLRVVNGDGKVERVCILSKMRNTGAGKRMMETIEKYAININVKKMILNAQLSAIPFYEKLGYTVISDVFMDAGIPHKTMEKHTIK